MSRFEKHLNNEDMGIITSIAAAATTTGILALGILLLPAGKAISRSFVSVKHAVEELMKTTDGREAMEWLRDQYYFREFVENVEEIRGERFSAKTFTNVDVEELNTKIERTEQEQKRILKKLQVDLEKSKLTDKEKKKIYMIMPALKG